MATETRTGPRTFTRTFDVCGPCNGTGKVVTEPKAVPPAPALVPCRLTEAEAATIRRTLDDPAVPTHDGADMPIADAAALRGPGR